VDAPGAAAARAAGRHAGHAADAALGTEDETFSCGLRRGEFIAPPEHAHSVHVEIEGLPSGRTWYYRFIAGDAVSPIGRTRTAPADDEPVQRLRIALASCQHYEQGWYAAHREIASRDLDLVLFVGDYIYESSNARFRLRAHEGPIPKTLWPTVPATPPTSRPCGPPLAADLGRPRGGQRLRRRPEPEWAEPRRFPASPRGSLQGLLRAPAVLAVDAAVGCVDAAARPAPLGPAGRVWTMDNRQHRSVACSPPGARRARAADCDTLGDPAHDVRRRAGARLAQAPAESARHWKLIAQATQTVRRFDTPLGRRVLTDG
jgi:alkaline phosphatase D